MENNVVKDHLTMTGILRWLEDNCTVKKTGEAFTLQDVQGYVRRRKLPEYLGGYKIVMKKNEYSKFYKLVEDNG